ncbi:hypothetical protein [Clostridium butyricum]|uniref:hypothetical protein n=1 Tax=Clostridium butyricum TaxID=1492 RepID=UPI0018AB6FC8|nr:hypothetical protein [Clostridium butyricum]
MKKTRMIKEMEKLLNEVEFLEDGYYIDISGINEDNKIILFIFEDDTEEIVLELKVSYIEDKYELITSFIREIYCEYINPLKKEIRKWTSFSRRKVESLSKWSKRDRIDKIMKINEEMIDRYKEIEYAKGQMYFYQYFIRRFCQAREQMTSLIVA